MSGMTEKLLAYTAPPARKCDYFRFQCSRNYQISAQFYYTQTTTKPGSLGFSLTHPACTGWPKKVSHSRESSLNRIKNRKPGQIFLPILIIK